MPEYIGPDNNTITEGYAVPSAVPVVIRIYNSIPQAGTARPSKGRVFPLTSK